MSKTEIQVFDNGPCIVRGEDVVLKDGAGREFDLGGKSQIALCRCGLSAKKPFCDGAHSREGFQSEVEAG